MGDFCDDDKLCKRCDGSGCPLGAKCEGAMNCEANVCGKGGVCCEIECGLDCMACNGSGKCEPVACGLTDACEDGKVCDGTTSTVPCVDDHPSLCP